MRSTLKRFVTKIKSLISPLFNPINVALVWCVLLALTTAISPFYLHYVNDPFIQDETEIEVDFEKTLSSDDEIQSASLFQYDELNESSQQTVDSIIQGNTVKQELEKSDDFITDSDRIAVIKDDRVFIFSTFIRYGSNDSDYILEKILGLFASFGVLLMTYDIYKNHKM